MRQGRRGGILIYMLGVITLLSIIVTEFLMDVAVSMRYRSQMTGRQDLEIIAYSALETSIAVLAEIKLLEEGLYAPVQGWGDPLKYAKLPVPSGYTVNVTIKDETGKLSIYDEKLNDFGNLLVEIGISYEQVVNLKSELKKYLEKFKKKESLGAPNQAPNQQPAQQAAPTQQPAQQANPTNQTNTTDRNRNQPRAREEKKAVQTLFSLNQLKEIPIFEKIFFDSKGNPNEKFQILKDNISVFNTGKVNINTAPALVKKMFLGPTSLGPLAEGKKFLKTMGDVGRTSNDDQFGFKANVFDIEIEVMRGPVKYHLSAIVEDKSAEAPRARRNGSGNQENAGATNGSGTPANPPANAPRNPAGTPRTPPRTGTNTSGNQANAGTGSGTSSGTSRGASGNQPNAPASSENKSNFVFLALTEDDSSVN